MSVVCWASTFHWHTGSMKIWCIYLIKHAFWIIMSCCYLILWYCFQVNHESTLEELWKKKKTFNGKVTDPFEFKFTLSLKQGPVYCFQNFFRFRDLPATAYFCRTISKLHSLVLSQKLHFFLIFIKNLFHPNSNDFSFLINCVMQMTCKLKSG